MRDFLTLLPFLLLGQGLGTKGARSLKLIYSVTNMPRTNQSGNLIRSATCFGR